MGEQTLAVSRNDLSFRFFTYTCLTGDAEPADNCKKGIFADKTFGDYWDQWTYLYFGYSKKIA